MAICVDGSIVSICLYLQHAFECKEKYEDGRWVGPYKTGYCTDDLIHPNGEHYGTICETEPAHMYNPSGGPYDETGEQYCSTIGTNIFLNYTADLTEVVGDTLWDRIQAHTGWQDEFEYLTCNCGTPGCAAHALTYSYNRCSVAANCTLGGSPDAPVESEISGAPVDRTCLYGAGTMGWSMS
jgi:hypothetical protein